jgi:hypothetical protein
MPATSMTSESAGKSPWLRAVTSMILFPLMTIVANQRLKTMAYGRFVNHAKTI